MLFKLGIICLLGYYLGNFRQCYDIKNNNWFGSKAVLKYVCLLKKKRGGWPQSLHFITANE